MKNPTSVSHLYRLGLVLLAIVVAVFTAAAVFAPTSWNYDISNWYRLNALEDLKEQPPAYGGIVSLKIAKRNGACKSCHKKEYKKIKRNKHKRLSCESCHGALADHVQGEKKVANAFVDNETRWQCLNCHEPLISRPKDFPQFRTDSNVVHKLLEPDTVCVDCHNPHDPTR